MAGVQLPGALPFGAGENGVQAGKARENLEQHDVNAMENFRLLASRLEMGAQIMMRFFRLMRVPGMFVILVRIPVRARLVRVFFMDMSRALCREDGRLDPGFGENALRRRVQSEKLFGMAQLFRERRRFLFLFRRIRRALETERDFERSFQRHDQALVFQRDFEMRFAMDMRQRGMDYANEGKSYPAEEYGFSHGGLTRTGKGGPAERE
jgi:hypothetical protein